MGSLPPIPYDGVSHHALGGPSHTYRTRYVEYIASLVANGPMVDVNLMVQPNNSPHVGTMVCLMLTFSLARELLALGLEPRVVIDLCDNANTERCVIDDVVYQRGLRATGKLDQHLDDFYHLIEVLSQRYGLAYSMRMEADLLAQPGMADVLRDIVRDRDHLGEICSPATKRIGIRAGCPTAGCGLVDKYGARNVYDLAKDEVRFHCPHHGPFALNIQNDASKFQLNNVFWTLAVGRLFANAENGYIQICGSDYAGFWQEQNLWRNLTKPIIIFYGPLIVDWAGSKISKSLYLKYDAYRYLREAGQEYLCSYDVFQREGKDLGILCNEVDLWLREPYRLFRAYSLQYLHLLFANSSKVEDSTFIFQKE